MHPTRLVALVSSVVLLASALAACGKDPEKPAPVAPVATKREVWIVSFPPDRKISVIAAVRDVAKLGLADAKALVERAPTRVVEAGDQAEALAVAKRLGDAGASVEIRGTATLK